MATRTADGFVECIMLDQWPSMGACVDFGIDDPDRDEAQKRYESYYYAVRAGEITADQLHEVMKSGGVTGEQLTELVRNAPSNPHKDVTITTSWDTIMGDDDEDTD